ncbi:MAG: SUF system Fe-S cluster assembly protein [Robiginitomaculum sp.]|nr:SUF system Fe-S cluster assembly protein [Robiginitomaculum sp.]
MDIKARDIIDISKNLNVDESTNFLPEEATDTAKDSSIPKEELERLTEDLIAAFKSVYDPEIPVDVYELGLIYKVDVSDDRDVEVDMTLTAPGCPVAGDMVMWVENAAASVAGVRGVTVNLIFEPPWTPARMSDEARLELNMF